MEYLNTSFNQARMSKDLQKYTTFPNGLAVFERGSGEMKILSTEEEYNNSFVCYSISGNSFKSFIEKCVKFEMDYKPFGGKLYVIDLWKVESPNDVKINEDLIFYFSQQPNEMFD